MTAATTRTAALPEGAMRLVELMRDLRFGTVENLVIQAGLPVWRPAPRIVREVRLDNRDEPSSGAAGDFALKAPVVNLLERFRVLGYGMVRALDVKHGLPFRLVVEEVAA